MKRRNRNRPLYCHRAPQGFDAFEFVHRLGSEIGLPAVRTRPHGNSLNYEKALPATKSPSDSPKLYAGATARGAQGPS